MHLNADLAPEVIPIIGPILALY